MTDDRMALMEALQKADDGNFLRSLAGTVLQIPMEADVEGMIGAGRYERSGERSTWRNGYRDRTLDTRLGQLNLRIPKLDTRKNSLIQSLFGARGAVATSICTAPGS
jgi:putative transposase